MSDKAPSSATTTKTKPSKPKGRRRYSREFVLQGIYQWRIVGGQVAFIEGQLRESELFKKADEVLFTDLLRGVLQDTQVLEDKIQSSLDRPLKNLSPIEYSILLMSTYELVNYMATPYRAIINEAIELAKIYGGTDGYKYINGVLDKMAAVLRADEVKSKR